MDEVADSVAVLPKSRPIVLESFVWCHDMVHDHKRCSMGHDFNTHSGLSKSKTESKSEGGYAVVTPVIDSESAEKPRAPVSFKHTYLSNLLIKKAA